MESKPDVVFSVGNWTMQSMEWTTSDHAAISGRIPGQVRKRKLLVTDWKTWEEFEEDEEEDIIYQDPIKHLKQMARDTLKVKKFSPKPWWDAEIKEQRKVVRRVGRNHGEWRKEAAKLRNIIK